jgi:hypothetical protein
MSQFRLEQTGHATHTEGLHVKVQIPTLLRENSSNQSAKNATATHEGFYSAVAISKPSSGQQRVPSQQSKRTKMQSPAPEK